MPVVTRAAALAWAERFAEDPLDDELLAAAAAARDAGWGNLVTYSPKVFIPLTKLCRDVCHYCTFARPPIEGRRAYLSLDEVLDIARAGAAAGCREALFTLGDKPELRYRLARDELAAMGHATTVEYLTVAAKAVLAKAGTPMHDHPEPSTAEMLGTVALARLILGPGMSVQAPPNLAESAQVLGSYLGAGINDWGGVSPVTIDHVNPEAPWPEIEQLQAMTEDAGFLLVPRLTVYPRYALDPAWVAKPVRPRVLALADGTGLGREAGWRAGDVTPPPAVLPGKSVPASYWTGSAALRLPPASPGPPARARPPRPP